MIGGSLGKGGFYKSVGLMKRNAFVLGSHVCGCGSFRK